MTFGETYLKHLEVLGNVGMTRIDPVEFDGQKIVPIQFLQARCCRIRRRSPRTTPARRRSAASSRASRTASQEALLHLQHLRPRRDLQGSPRAGGLLHDRRARGDRRGDDGDRQVEAAPACATWSSSIPIRSSRRRQARPALARRRALSDVASAALGAEMARARSTSRSVETPCFVTDLGALEANLELLATCSGAPAARSCSRSRASRSGRRSRSCKQYLAGATASSVAEARLAREELGGEVHAYAPAYSDERDCASSSRSPITSCSTRPRSGSGSAIVARRARRASRAGCASTTSTRKSRSRSTIRPAPCSRLGTTRANFAAEDLDGLDGLHFHTLCENSSDALERAVAAFEQKFGEFIPRMKWVNFGGGHHITRPDYDVERLVRAGARRSAALERRRSTSSPARRSRSAPASSSRSVHRHVRQRHDDRDPRHVGDRAHARRARDAVPAR